MHKTMLTLMTLALFPLSLAHLSAQTGVITLKNPSFEDFPRHSKTPITWIDCGFEGESEPDINPSGEFGVTMIAQHGETYLGMVVRDNETWERVSTKLSQSMQKGQCYEFNIFLARSAQYLSASRITNKEVNYITPVKLRIYGGHKPCDAIFLLAETTAVKKFSWVQYRLNLKPDDNYSYIMLEVVYVEPDSSPYNGNLLLDNASAIVPILCEEKGHEK